MPQEIRYYDIAGNEISEQYIDGAVETIPEQDLEFLLSPDGWEAYYKDGGEYYSVKAIIRDTKSNKHFYTVERLGFRVIPSAPQGSYIVLDKVRLL